MNKCIIGVFSLFVIIIMTAPMYGASLVSANFRRATATLTRRSAYPNRLFVPSRKYSTLPAMAKTKYTSSHTSFFKTHSKDSDKHNGWNTNAIVPLLAGSAGLLLYCLTQSSAHAEGASVDSESLYSLLRPLSEDEKMTIIDEDLFRTKKYHTGKNGRLNETDIKQLYKSIFKKDFQKLDQKIEHTIYSYLEEIGFYNPRQYVFLSRYNGENNSVFGVSRDTGERTGFVLINQSAWHASSLIDNRSNVLHEIFHILGRHVSRKFLVNVDAIHHSYRQQDQYPDLEREDLQKKRHQETEINEVFAEIAAKDFGNYPQRHLLVSAITNIHHKNDKISYEVGHLTPLEKPYAIKMWEKLKKELTLPTPKSLIEYNAKNAQALRDFSEKYVKNRRENIKKADDYAQAQWKLNPTFTDEDYKDLFNNTPKGLHPTIENEVISFFQQELDTLTLNLKCNIRLYGEHRDQNTDSIDYTIIDENIIVQIGFGWKSWSLSEKRRLVAECFKGIVAADNRRTS